MATPYRPRSGTTGSLQERNVLDGGQPIRGGDVSANYGAAGTAEPVPVADSGGDRTPESVTSREGSKVSVLSVSSTTIGLSFQLALGVCALSCFLRVSFVSLQYVIQVQHSASTLFILLTIWVVCAVRALLSYVPFRREANEKNNDVDDTGLPVETGGTNTPGTSKYPLFELSKLMFDTRDSRKHSEAERQLDSSNTPPTSGQHGFSGFRERCRSVAYTPCAAYTVPTLLAWTSDFTAWRGIFFLGPHVFRVVVGIKLVLVPLLVVFVLRRSFSALAVTGMGILIVSVGLGLYARILLMDEQGERHPAGSQDPNPESLESSELTSGAMAATRLDMAALLIGVAWGCFSAFCSACADIGDEFAFNNVLQNRLTTVSQQMLQSLSTLFWLSVIVAGYFAVCVGMHYVGAGGGTTIWSLPFITQEMAKTVSLLNLIYMTASMAFVMVNVVLVKYCGAITKAFVDSFSGFVITWVAMDFLGFELNLLFWVALSLNFAAILLYNWEEVRGGYLDYYYSNDYKNSQWTVNRLNTVNFDERIQMKTPEAIQRIPEDFPGSSAPTSAACSGNESAKSDTAAESLVNESATSRNDSVTAAESIGGEKK